MGGGGGGGRGGKGGIVTSRGISKGYPSPVFVNRDTRQLRGAVTVIGWVVFAGSMDQSKHRYASPLSLSLSFLCSPRVLAGNEHAPAFSLVRELHL